MYYVPRYWSRDNAYLSMSRAYLKVLKPERIVTDVSNRMMNTF